MANADRLEAIHSVEGISEKTDNLLPHPTTYDVNHQFLRRTPANTHAHTLTIRSDVPLRHPSPTPHSELPPPALDRTGHSHYIRRRRVARADEWGGLENRCGFRLTVGSNPTLSAKRTPGKPGVLVVLVVAQIGAAKRFGQAQPRSGTGLRSDPRSVPYARNEEI